MWAGNGDPNNPRDAAAGIVSYDESPASKDCARNPAWRSAKAPMHLLGCEDLVAPFNHDIPIGKQAVQNLTSRSAVGRKYDFAGIT
jgi:hypothetical protein